MTELGRPSNHPLRGALVGYGFIGSLGHLPAYRALQKKGRPIEIVALADVCEARRALAHQAYPNARIYPDHTALLEAESSRLDFVDVCAPPAFHAEIAHAALDHGLHVLCEKPLTTRIEDAKALLEHARSARRVLFPAHNYKSAPVSRRVKQIVDSGQIGKITLVTLQTFRTTHAKGVPEWRTDWRRERKYSGGGIAMDHGSHTFYLAFDWIGSYPTAISAITSTSGGWDTEDNIACGIRFPGAMASAHISWTAGVRKVIYTLHGERGAIRVEDDALELTVLDPETGKRNSSTETLPSDWMDASHVIWFESLLEGFTDAIKRSDFAGKEAEDALRCVELIQTAYASAAEGGRELPLGRAGTKVL